jgi:hypothetical protein
MQRPTPLGRFRRAVRAAGAGTEALLTGLLTGRSASQIVSRTLVAAGIGFVTAASGAMAMELVAPIASKMAGVFGLTCRSGGVWAGLVESQTSAVLLQRAAGGTGSSYDKINGQGIYVFRDRAAFKRIAHGSDGSEINTCLKKAI